MTEYVVPVTRESQRFQHSNVGGSTSQRPAPPMVQLCNHCRWNPLHSHYKCMRCLSCPRCRLDIVLTHREARRRPKPRGLCIQHRRETDYWLSNYSTCSRCWEELQRAAGRLVYELDSHSRGYRLPRIPRIPRIPITTPSSTTTLTPPVPRVLPSPLPPPRRQDTQVRPSVSRSESSRLTRTVLPRTSYSRSTTRPSSNDDDISLSIVNIEVNITEDDLRSALDEPVPLSPGEIRPTSLRRLYDHTNYEISDEEGNDNVDPDLHDQEDLDLDDHDLDEDNDDEFEDHFLGRIERRVEGEGGTLVAYFYFKPDE